MNYEQFAKKHLHGFQNIECFCRFLETAAANSIRGQGIQWLANYHQMIFSRILIKA
ncbi:hypothetical protein [Candidatus Parabeggiatoa sp. HSG14]|uniref:hypothetical protein n=1 Tax=Candidatus Parabeggiatoa sp. HSG14 TaxID=3055593 RepID=UPI0025A8036D|nr:hypothetical protein [Thiotrichales bacterium HSG14]